jgi:predicted DNA-binding protein
MGMKTQYITDEKGKISAVIVPKKEYERMLAISEEFEDLQAFDNAVDKIKSGEEEFVSLEDILKKVNK